MYYSSTISYFLNSGQTIYFGEIGKNSSSVIKYFEKEGARKCQQNENPAEYILEAIGAGAHRFCSTELV
ncbi:BGN_3a_G0047380.mRNA.1.CDS.1 [Saccharomyces cerevisiae]|nr:BGN_3a_G0047380.mRNA.1.CDS.1 [Saccharomyces cerevisiae]CAI7320869.1 BGN_3a_G0047380.mRNA.1.CDS.1 [Saccharomyces cerevisiae]